MKEWNMVMKIKKILNLRRKKKNEDRNWGKTNLLHLWEYDAGEMNIMKKFLDCIIFKHLLKSKKIFSCFRRFIDEFFFLLLIFGYFPSLGCEKKNKKQIMADLKVGAGGRERERDRSDLICGDDDGLILSCFQLIILKSSLIPFIKWNLIYTCHHE